MVKPCSSSANWVFKAVTDSLGFSVIALLISLSRWAEVHFGRPDLGFGGVACPVLIISGFWSENTNLSIVRFERFIFFEMSLHENPASCRATILPFSKSERYFPTIAKPRCFDCINYVGREWRVTYLVWRMSYRCTQRTQTYTNIQIIYLTFQFSSNIHIFNFIWLLVDKLLNS